MILFLQAAHRSLTVSSSALCDKFSARLFAHGTHTVDSALFACLYSVVFPFQQAGCGFACVLTGFSGAVSISTFKVDSFVSISRSVPHRQCTSSSLVSCALPIRVPHIGHMIYSFIIYLLPFSCLKTLYPKNMSSEKAVATAFSSD